MTSDGSSFGDNTDVKPPAADELWHGSFVRIYGDGSGSHESQPVKLTLDGIFFVDGGFAGPNRLGAWEQTTLPPRLISPVPRSLRKPAATAPRRPNSSLRCKRSPGKWMSECLPHCIGRIWNPESRSAYTSCRWSAAGSSTCANVWAMRQPLRPSKLGRMRRYRSSINVRSLPPSRGEYCDSRGRGSTDRTSP